MNCALNGKSMINMFLSSYKIRKALFPLISSWVSINDQKNAIKNFEHYDIAIDAIREKIGESLNTEQSEPIFIFSAGWRSGSTLLQRLIVSYNRTLIWGEPFDKSNIIQNFTDTLGAFDDSWPPKQYFFNNENSKNLSSSWIANLYPSTETLITSYRNFFKNTFFDATIGQEYDRWGIKEVRWGYREALFLKLLFPKGRFLFLNRNAEDAYLSYKSFSKNLEWYNRWPYDPAFTPYQFARQRFVLEKEHKRVLRQVNGISINYEELISDISIANKISEYLSLKLNSDVLGIKVGNCTNRDSVQLTNTERISILLARQKFK